MTWQQLYQHLDDDALSTWANPGLLRRAKKALEAGEVSLVELRDDGGTWHNDDATVTLTAQGLTKAACNCPAAGACKHILAAVLHLQQQANSAPAQSVTETVAAAIPADIAVPVEAAAADSAVNAPAVPTWLQSYQLLDDAALSTWANSGLLRRAKKAVEAGEVSLLSLDEAQGQWQNDDAVVTLNPQGLSQSACNCPAAGACKHIVAAVLAAQQVWAEAAENIATNTDAANGTTASADNSVAALQAALSEATDLERLQLGKIGKVQWRQAYALWADWQQQVPPRIDIQPAKILFHTDLSSDAVVYLLGGGFAGMLSSLDKKRQIPVHLAVLAQLWQQQQLVFPWPDEVVPDENTDASVLGEDERSLLLTLQAACQRLLQLGLNHLMASEAQQWQWLQLSARVERLPRLAGMLRRLAGEVRLLAENHISSDSNDTLLSLARLAAYLDALLHAEGEALLALRGVLRRTYQTQDEAMTLLPLGVNWWQGEGGASGLNVYVWSVEEAAIMTTVQARGNANDRSFNRYSAWSGAGFWNRSAEQIMQNQIVLRAPRVFGDRLANQVAVPSQAQPLTADFFAPALTPYADLIQHSIEQTTPFLLSVSRYEPLYLDELEQSLEWVVYDDSQQWGAQLSLVINEVTRERSQQLQWLCEKNIAISAVLVLARLDGQQVILEPISVMLAEHAEPVRCLDYHQFSPKQFFWQRKQAKPALLRSTIGAAASSEHWLDTLCAPVWRLLEARTASGVRAWLELEREQLLGAAAQAEALGLDLLKTLWQRLAQEASAGNMLQSAHVMQLARQCQQQWPLFEVELQIGENDDGNGENA
ncbi:SWIM zinc finger family protein [Vitreoscilla massiliensis]|uniref:SWIM zinc finger family protein n=1 Tax=Vitreoscilla massiliensis TaxID=1689272 RepID=A0ABY4DZ96_9NEIS|nr:SWIM zinc finger family protein [Vitreoscilla massiliensis]UOO88841.1 SWIM zinc finger family protein [Vitreoscilla massiliensis]